MKIRIRQDDYGEPITVNTTGPLRIALVGPPGCGMTATRRYITRRCSAHCGRPGLTITPRGYEYRDLAEDGLVTLADRDADVAASPGPLIVDEAEHLSGDAVRQALRSARDVVLAPSFGAALAAMDIETQLRDGARC